MPTILPVECHRGDGPVLGPLRAADRIRPSCLVFEPTVRSRTEWRHAMATTTRPSATIAAYVPNRGLPDSFLPAKGLRVCVPSKQQRTESRPTARTELPSVARLASVS